MKTLAKILFHFYLTLLLVLVFIPLGAVLRLLCGVKCMLFPSRKSYFKNTQTTASHNTGVIRSYNLLNFFVLQMVKPCLWLGRFLKISFLTPKPSLLQATPNKAAALCLSQLIRNTKTISSIAEQTNTKYIFALQPSLLYTGPSTTGDKIFYESKNQQRLWGFPFADFVKTYYTNLIQTFRKDPQLKNQFVDLSSIFSNCKKQRFVDTVHMGNKAQEECAQKLAESIFETFYTNKK
jgi:hypothetical protein